MAKDAQKSDKVVEIKAIDGVRYTVPSTIHVDNMADLLTVRFRVGVFKNSYISVYLNDERVQHHVENRLWLQARWNRLS